MTNIVFDVYGMNPIEIEIFLKRNFDFHGFSRCGEGRFTVLCPRFYTDSNRKYLEIINVAKTTGFDFKKKKKND